MVSSNVLGLGISIVIIIGASIGLAFTATRDVVKTDTVYSDTAMDTRYMFDGKNATCLAQLTLDENNQANWY